MSQKADFFGIEFEADYLLFSDEMKSLPGVYIVYTEKACLEIETTEDFKNSVETDGHTRDWLELSKGNDIYIAFHFDKNKESREDKKIYLKSKMQPLL